MNAPKVGRLVYVMGPSGAGKDSLLAWLQAHLPPEARIRLAQRTITRPVRAGDEQHHSVDLPAFERLAERGAFAFDWEANAMRYGIRHSELAPLQDGWQVLVNGSRGYLPRARAAFPELKVVHVTASLETLRARLHGRGREEAERVEARLQRALAFEAPADALEIRNDGTLEAAGLTLLAALQVV